jgi:hypothetical protein
MRRAPDRRSATDSSDTFPNRNAGNEVNQLAKHDLVERRSVIVLATGEALAELIADGVARSTDLTPFDPMRLQPFDPSLLRSS